jgi:hypothetical protein
LTQIITIKKDPVWLIYAGVFFLLIGSLGFVPFKFAWWGCMEYVFNLLFVIGIIVALRCTQKIGWRLSLKGNVLYYQKFNLFSSWKKRRSAEFSLPIDKITSAHVENGFFQVKYQPGRELRFNTKGITRSGESKLKSLIIALNS